jgi:hypothetical protein
MLFLTLLFLCIGYYEGGAYYGGYYYGGYYYGGAYYGGYYYGGYYYTGGPNSNSNDTSVNGTVRHVKRRQLLATTCASSTNSKVLVHVKMLDSGGDGWEVNDKNCTDSIVSFSHLF